MRAQKIVLFGGCGLAFGAAFANTGVLLSAGTSVSHLTGDISRLSIDLVRASPSFLSEMVQVFSAALSFFIGAFFAGYFIHHPSLDLARPYGKTISIIGIFFIVAHMMMVRYPVAAISLSALACGLQNSLATRYRGIVLRTTHLTGLITDFGITLGMSLRGLEIPRWKIAVPALLTAAFFFGGMSAALVVFFTKSDPLLLAGVAYVTAGIAWTFVKQVNWRTRRGDDETEPVA